MVWDRTNPRKPRQCRAQMMFTNESGGLMQSWQWTRVFRPAADVAGLKPSEVLHLLRHLYASLLIRHGESVKTVQHRLGHAKATTTLNAYGHLWPDADDTTRAAIAEGLSGYCGARTERGLA
ncbi:tyrosine-type recombinase/integrase [Saccharopolyspora sp. 5N708]|uniref:tyrosine-type recombinase/integrase n=1 Tax=Saccharopolyspora sp. 5N708 TaxID=3457424 RepID=UPI003FD56C05